MALTIYDPAFDQNLTLRQSLEVLSAFLRQFNSRSPEGTDLLATWIELQSDGITADPAQLEYYLASARRVLSSGA